MIPSKNQAIETAILGDWKNATEINKAILNDNPKDVEALNRLAFALTVRGKLKNAKTIYKKVLEIDSLNPIALKNIKRLSETSSPKNIKNSSVSVQVNHTFIEETGKTKIVELINIAQPKITARLTIGELMNICIKRSKIFIQQQNKQYIGMLPDDIGKRLIKFVKGGNKYEACIKSANSRHIIIFLREIKKMARFKNQTSFSQIAEKNLSLEKKTKKSHKDDTEDDFITNIQEIEE